VERNTGLLAVFLLFSCSGFDGQHKAAVKSLGQNTGVHLVELFTSEGCSSCPPADRLLEKIKDEDAAIVLSYHVDYWDKLGWKDPFSQAAFTERQRQYAGQFSLESIYTPQAVVNGGEEFVGSDEKKLRTALQKNSGGAVILSANAERKNPETVQLRYSLANTSSLLLNITLVQSSATTAVAGGENGGHTLHHVNVVRKLLTIDPQKEGSVEISVPASLQQMPLSVVAFTQEKGSGRINGAVQLALTSAEGGNQ